MACCRVKGKPTLFVTMTTNPEWDEIKENLLPGQTTVKGPDITARVFAADTLTSSCSLVHTCTRLTICCQGAL